MSKKVISIGFQIPGGEFEHETLSSKRSLLDADIILYQPSVPKGYEPDTYKGKTCLSDDGSFRAIEALAHWRRELSAAVDAGKLVVVFLKSPEIVFAATGEVRHDGTGRNARQTRVVTEMDSYAAVPLSWKFQEARGSEILNISKQRFFAPYWQEFAPYSHYETFIEGEFKEPLLRTKSGNRILGVCIRKGMGALLALPVLRLDDKSFIKRSTRNGVEKAEWTEAAAIFGRKLISSLIGIAATLSEESAQTPPPVWISSDKYTLEEEREISQAVSDVIKKISLLEEEKAALDSKYEKAGSLRRLLYEQGKQLETSVIESLEILGFKANGLREKDSEFDAVFESSEGRFIGEVEGKDNKAINIDKFSQLERNLNEDFAREGVSEFATGVLFGNAYRLTPPGTRDNAFTDKCLLAAKRLGVVLVRTEDLFLPCSYIKSSGDEDYAKNCRQALRAAAGEIVKFPNPPGVTPDLSPQSSTIATDEV